MRSKIFSFFYRFTRLLVTNILYGIQKVLWLPKDLEPAVKLGDAALRSFFVLKKVVYDFPLPKNCEVEMFDLRFPSPLIGSSFKSDDKILEMWLRMGIGGVIIKTIMREKRHGNPRPRIQDIKIRNEKGLLNSLGLPGPGINIFLDQIIKSSIWSFNRPIGISVGGTSEQEYITNVDKIQAALGNQFSSYFFELNISCPNTTDGQIICDNPSQLDSLIREIRRNHSKTISIKVSPDVSDSILADIGKLCSEYESIIINAGNTHYKERGELGLKENLFAMEGGGLSGPSIFPRTLSMVKIFSQFRSPIMATGGISTIHHVNLLKESGASLFGMATSLVLDPYCIPRLNEEI